MSEDIRFERRMSDADALMWAIEKDPLLRSTITAVSIFDRAPDAKRLRERVERGTRLIPRLRQRVVGAPLVASPPRWVVDTNFDLDYHLRWVSAPAPADRRALLDLAEPIGMQGFDRARPLWEFTVVEGLADGKAAFIQKLHHSITDGVGAIKLAMVLFDLEREPGDPGSTPGPPVAEHPTPWELTFEALQHERRRQFGIARRSIGAATRAARRPAANARAFAELAASAGRILAPATTPHSTVMTERSLSVNFATIAVALDETKRAAKAAGGKLNDAFLAAVCGGMRLYHERHGTTVEQLRTTMPISIRDEATATLAGNQFVPARFLIPIGIRDPIERMRVIRQLVAFQRNEPALTFTDAIAGILNRLPTALVTQLFGSMLKGVDFVTSNVPGVPVPVFFAGAALESQVAFGPLTGAATNITLVSYLDDLHIGVNMDRAAIPDRDVFIDCLKEGFDEVRKVV
jgi:diacylglycerol O-acyltransferase / wax synthase